MLCVQDITGWGENDRGVSYTFGRDVVFEFLRKHKLSLIARAHQVRVTLISRPCTCLPAFSLYVLCPSSCRLPCDL